METFEAYIKDYLRDKYKKKADELYSQKSSERKMRNL